MKQKSIISKIFKICYYVIISCLCLLALFIVSVMTLSELNANNPDYRPLMSMYTIVSPSMNPIIKVYDVVVNIKVNNIDDIQVGDIITYISESPNSEGMRITHRVISIIETDDETKEFITQGDNNSNPDTLSVSFDKVLGKEIFIIPALGRLQFLIANKKSWLLLLLIPIMIYIIKDSKKLIELLGLRRKVDKAAGIIEMSSKDIKKEKELLRKEQIRQELERKEIYAKARIKSKDEPKSFVLDNGKTIINIKENKYIKLREENKVANPRQGVAVAKKEVTSKAATTKKEVKTNIENKVREYNNKIKQLDKMLKILENEPPKKVENNNDFLKEKKIKIVSSTHPSVNITLEASMPKLKSSNSKVKVNENQLKLNPHAIRRVSKYKSRIAKKDK